MIRINKKQFKKDFNSKECNISNEQLRNKYRFKTNKEMCDYAYKNNLVIVREKTEEEKKNLSLMSKQLNECAKLLK